LVQSVQDFGVVRDRYPDFRIVHYCTIGKKVCQHDSRKKLRTDLSKIFREG